MKAAQVHITECPRDAMQGIHDFIPTELKIRYLNALLDCGFDTLDFGSFVSPKAVPQLADTVEVLTGLKPSATKLLAIVANLRGAEQAAGYERVNCIGYPFSVSETFQIRNTNRSVSDSLGLVEEMQALCSEKKKTFVVYLSMAFGNPYGDPWSFELVKEWSEKIAALGVGVIALADTIGSSEPVVISELFSAIIPALKQVEIGAHFHSVPEQRKDKISAAWNAGCRRFDVALKGYGGCPFAKDELTGNISTESLLEFLGNIKAESGVDRNALQIASSLAEKVFSPSSQR